MKTAEEIARKYVNIDEIPSMKRGLLNAMEEFVDQFRTDKKFTELLEWIDKNSYYSDPMDGEIVTADCVRDKIKELQSLTATDKGGECQHI